MKTNYELRYAAHPKDAKNYDTARLREDFLIQNLFVDNEVNMVYSMYDRLIVGGAKPVGETLVLEAIDPLKATHFLSRREIGIFNVGGAGRVKVDGKTFDLDFKEALYLGCGDRTVSFESVDAAKPAKFYFNSAPAHRNCPDKKVTKADAIVAEMGSLDLVWLGQKDFLFLIIRPSDRLCRHCLCGMIWKYFFRIQYWSNSISPDVSDVMKRSIIF